MWDLVLDQFGGLHAVDSFEPAAFACGRTPGEFERIARDVSTTWAYRLIGGRGFEPTVSGGSRNADGVSHCADCVGVLANWYAGVNR